MNERFRGVLRLTVVFAIAAGANATVADRTFGAGPAISILPTQPVPGQRVSVRGVGFCPEPCSPITVSVDGAVAASAVVSADGTFIVEVGLTPVSGTSTVTASQTTSTGQTSEATAVVHVVASDQTAAPATLPPSPPSTTVTTVGSLVPLIAAVLAVVAALLSAVWFRLRRSR